jgi:hypothetical protein
MTATFPGVEYLEHFPVLENRLTFYRPLRSRVITSWGGGGTDSVKELILGLRSGIGKET